MHQSSGLRRYARVVGAAAGAGVIASALTAVTPGAFAALPDATVTNQGNPAVADALNGNAPSPDGGVYSVGYEVVPVADNPPGDAPKYPANRAILVTKSKADGSLDTSWGGGTGRVTVDLVSAFHESIPAANAGSKELANGVAVDSQGRLLVVGQIEGDQSDARSAVDTDVFVARLHPTGALDRSYGNSGWTRINLSDGYAPGGAALGAADAAGWTIALRPNKKAVIAAAIGLDSDETRTARDAAAVQLKANGGLDASFGDGGVASIPTPQGDNVRRGLLDSDGSFFVTSYANVGANNQPFIPKFTPSGQPDESWGDEGLYTGYPGGNGGFAEAYGMHKDADGNYTVTGYGYSGSRPAEQAGNSVDAIMFSLTPNGDPNRAWGDKGFIGYHVGSDGNNSGDRHRDHAILPDGRIVGIGGTGGAPTGEPARGDAIITVTNADGTPGEVKVVDFGGTDDQLWGISTVGDGYTVLASGWGNTGDSQVVSIDLSATESATTLELGTSSAPYGAANTATVGLSVDGAPAAGSVDVTVDGDEVETVAVDASGSATVDLPQTLAAGDHEVEATFAGGDGVTGSSASATVTVTKAATGTTVALPKQVKSSKKATATVKVTADGVPSGVFPTGKVTVTSGSKKLGTATLKASDKGSVKIKLPKLKVKTHTIKVAYAGNANLKKSSGKAKLKVVK